MIRGIALATAMIVGLLLGPGGCQGANKKETTTGAPAAKTGGAGGAVKVEMYVMSQCPYGVQALDGIIPALQKIGDGVDLAIEYIGRDNGGVLESMHGESEVAGNIAQLCAAKIAPAAHLKFISCVNKEWRSIPGNTESCASEAGIDAAAFKACKDGDEGKALLAASFKRAEQAGATGSPTIKVNGQPYAGGRSPDDFTRSLCAEFGAGSGPKYCAELPPPPEVNVLAITDKRCKDCQVEPIIASLKGPFSGLKAKVLDFSEPEAKAACQEAGVKYLPAVLFDESINKDENGAKQMARWLEPAGKYKSLKLGAEFDPTAEICDNGGDDTGNSLVDCADPTCKESLVCRPEKKGALDVFVMSQCPYGVLGLDAMKEVLEAFEGELEFGVHYIAAEKDGEFQALHGPPEVAENIRQLCAIKHYKDKFMDYIWCRNENIRSEEWQKCTGANGIATAVIEKCSTGGEGKQLHSEDIKFAHALKIGGSPTWLVNNRHMFNGVAAQDIQKQLCDHNPGLKGCAKQLSGKPSGAPQGSCGG